MRVHLHVHQGRRVHVQDVFSFDRYLELSHRLLRSISRHPTHDDVEGHKFHGNQYVTVAGGAKPEVATAKGVKNGVAQLLASGHPFSLEELMSATGAKLPQQIHNAIADLKKSTPPGALELVKEGKHYKVKLKEGMAVPEAIKVAASQPIAQPPKAPPAPVPEVPAPSSAPTKKSKEEADANYDMALLEHLSGLGINSHLATTEEMKKQALLDFKNAKAESMAQWKADMTGLPIEPIKKQEVFQADLQLLKDMTAIDNDPEAAIDNDPEDMLDAYKKWKHNTNLEKQGLFPPPKPINEMPKAHIPQPMVAHKPAFQAMPDYVPAGHKHVDAEDFKGGPNSKFVKSMHTLAHKLEAGHPNAVLNKIGVQKALENHLTQSPAFQELQKNYGNGSLAARLISAWAGTSGDHNPISVANQIAVREAFGMKQEHLSAGSMSSLHKSESDDESAYQLAAEKLGCKYKTPAEKETFKAGMRDFALAQYHNTQEHFKQLGITEVSVVRGMKIAHGSGPAIIKDIKLMPASSFSAQYSTAMGFSGGQTLYFAKVPVSQVLSSYVTGFGCSSEHEVVVLAHPDLKCVRMSAGKGPSLDTAAEHIEESLSGKKVAAPAQAPAPSSSPAPLSGYFMPPHAAVASKHVKAMHSAAVAGNWEQYEKEKENFTQYKINTGTKMPASTKYMKELESQVKIHKKNAPGISAIAEAMGNATAAPVVKKNAYWYKKIKEAVESHPHHTPETYAALKGTGKTNEEILNIYKTIAAKGAMPA